MENQAGCLIFASSLCLACQCMERTYNKIICKGSRIERCFTFHYLYIFSKNFPYVLLTWTEKVDILDFAKESKRTCVFLIIAHIPGRKGKKKITWITGELHILQIYLQIKSNCYLRRRCCCHVLKVAKHSLVLSL